MPLGDPRRLTTPAAAERSDRVKLLAWDGSGMVLVTKWLEEGRFTWPPIRDGVITLTGTQLSMLIEGLQEYPFW
jgi:transposase